MFLFKDEHCTAVEGTTADILSAAPWGAYTRFCTVQRERILYLDEHATRLRRSLLDMLGDQYVKFHHLSLPDVEKHRAEANEKLTESYLSAYMVKAANCILKEIPAGDIRVDVHISAYEPGFPMFAIGTLVPDQDEVRDTVLLVRGERGTPTVKDTQWIKERKPLEGLVKGKVEEVVLMDGDGYLYEGISSSFFVLLQGANGSLILQTAEDVYVLRGTVRSMVLSIAESLNVSIEMSRPSVTDIGRWVGVFITSTTRRVKPISHVSFDGAVYDFTTVESSRFKTAIEQSEINRGSLLTNK